MRSARVLALASAVALVMTIMPPGGQVVVHATPKTLMETLTDLPEAASAAPQTKANDGEVATAGVDPAAAVSRSEVIDAPLTFNLLGVSAPEGASAIRARTFDGEAWSSWTALEFLDEEDGPDAATDEAAEADQAVAAIGGIPTEPLWVSEASKLQIEVEGATVSDLSIDLIDSMGSSGGPVQRIVESRPEGATADASDLQIVSRAQWGADESLRGSSTPSYAREVHMGVVHHTAHSPNTSVANGYSRAEAPGVMRAMYQYHTTRLGWADLGYNVVIDRFGTVYEGRAGGFERPVIGAHARGFNTGSFGVSVMGNFVDQQAPPAAIDALTRVIGIKSAIHGVDPTGWNDRMGGGTWRANIVGHRDVGQTSCPGRISSLLPQIRDGASAYSMRFPDVPTSSPHRPAIIKLAEDGIATGCRLNEYCPRSGLNRAQASSFVLRTFGLEAVPGTPFRDVDAHGAHTGAINALAQRGWLQGYVDGTFGPWDQLTRGQLATLLGNALDLPMPVPATNPYPDVPRNSTHAPAIAALRDIGITGNCGSGNFCANDIALRDSTASFLEMARQHQRQIQGSSSSDESDDDAYPSLLDGLSSDDEAGVGDTDPSTS